MSEVRRLSRQLSAAVLVFIGLVGPGSSAEQKEWLSLCSRCPSPTVTSKTGAGTARAVAEARMSRTELKDWCTQNEPDAVGACVQREMTEGGSKVFRATADCTAGRITTIQGETYALAGLWDNSDIGGGRTKWKGSDGQIVGRDNASNGLAISQQWEVLCPGRVNPVLLAQVGSGTGTPSRASHAGPAAPSPQSTSVCAGKRYCDENSLFAAIVRDFRPSVADRSTHVVSATVRFLNKTNRPLILGYVRNAGVAIDEQGNRYLLPTVNNVRGIAEITGGREFDPKFTLQPGRTADAQFEFVWQWNGRDVIGQRAWDVNLTVREVREIAPGQYRFGQESVLQFKAVPPANTMTMGAPASGTLPAVTNSGAPAAVLEGGPSMQTPPAASIAMAASSSPAAAASGVPAGTPPEPDACAGRSRCFDAGAFVAEIAQATVTREGNFQDRVARLTIRFRNKTNQPLALAYVPKSGVLIDNFGKRFAWGRTSDLSASGIGVVDGNKADPQFVLRPGESRQATFTLYRFRPAKTDPDGSGYSYTTVIAQLEVLYNGQQVRTVRESTLTFPDFGIAGPAGGMSSVPGAATQNQTVKELGDRLRNVLGGKKK